MSITPDRIKALRLSLGLTSGEFADALCYSRGHQVHLEAGRRGLSSQGSLLFRLLEQHGLAALDALRNDTPEAYQQMSAA
jgi:DNA-binding transcriptional regulator YiaG